MKLKIFFLIFFSTPLLAQELSCQISGKIVPVAEYPQPKNVFTKLKNDGHPMTAFGFFISHSEALGNKKAARDYCQSLSEKTRTVMLSGQYPDDHFQAGQHLSIKHLHRDKNVWPYWPNFYWVTVSPE